MKTEAIVASAGIGRRLTQGRVRKPYLDLLGKPILVHTLRALSNSRDINDIIVVVNKLDLARCVSCVKKYKIKKIKKIITGGKHRFDSVYNGLRVLDNDTDIVLIHDGVRPFIDGRIIKNSIDLAAKFGACIVGVPVKATIKRVQGAGYRVQGTVRVRKTIDRKDLWEIQTPQVFKKDLILKAYKKFGDLAVTDDSMLVEKLGVRVKAIEGSYKNIKITTPEDLVIAEAILRSNK